MIVLSEKMQIDINWLVSRLVTDAVWDFLCTKDKGSYGLLLFRSIINVHIG